VASTANSGSIAAELEQCIPELFICISSGQLDEQHGAMLCLAAMIQGKAAFPNAVKKFLEMDGYGRIFRMMNVIAASPSSSLPSALPLSSSSASKPPEANSYMLLAEGFASEAVLQTSHIACHTSRQV
jgi:hypothetical protein